LPRNWSHLPCHVLSRTTLLGYARVGIPLLPAKCFCPHASPCPERAFRDSPDLACPRSCLSNSRNWSYWSFNEHRYGSRARCWSEDATPGWALMREAQSLTHPEKILDQSCHVNNQHVAIPVLRNPSTRVLPANPRVFGSGGCIAIPCINATAFTSIYIPHVASRRIRSYRRAYVRAYDLPGVEYDPLATSEIRSPHFCALQSACQ
jgi:hypothetical protein